MKVGNSTSYSTVCKLDCDVFYEFLLRQFSLALERIFGPAQVSVIRRKVLIRFVLSLMKQSKQTSKLEIVARKDNRVELSTRNAGVIFKSSFVRSQSKILGIESRVIHLLRRLRPLCSLHAKTNRKVNEKNE